MIGIGIVVLGLSFIGLLWFAIPNSGECNLFYIIPFTYADEMQFNKTTFLQTIKQDLTTEIPQEYLDSLSIQTSKREKNKGWIEFLEPFPTEFHPTVSRTMQGMENITDVSEPILTGTCP